MVLILELALTSGAEAVSDCQRKACGKAGKIDLKQVRGPFGEEHTFGVVHEVRQLLVEGRPVDGPACHYINVVNANPA
jgi:hypothetical protein